MSQQLIDRGARCLVVALAHSEFNPENERKVRQTVKSVYPRDFLGSVPVFLSSDISKRSGDRERINAAVVIASPKAALEPTRDPWVESTILCTGSFDNPRDLTHWETDYRGCRLAYEKAGIGPHPSSPETSTFVSTTTLKGSPLPLFADRFDFIKRNDSL